jgi:hypothetical protein
MSKATLEQRLTELEKQLSELKARVEKLDPPKDWRSVVGMFAGDEVMKRIDEAGRKYREADRRKTRNAGRAKRAKSRP